MPSIYLLDSGPLGLLAHDRPAHRGSIHAWVLNELSLGSTVYLSEVADYEVRREIKRMIQANQLPATRLQRLDSIAQFCKKLPMTTQMWLLASDLWATARTNGVPSAHQASLDADVLLAAQALEVGGTVVTKNTNHFAPHCSVLSWPRP